MLSLRTITVATTAGATALAAAPAGAQAIDYGAFEALFGEPVTTSATGQPQRASEAPANMTIITAEDIRRSGARDIPGLLRHVGGAADVGDAVEGAGQNVKEAGENMQGGRHPFRGIGPA